MVEVGSPLQTLRVMPGTSATASNIIRAILPQGCDGLNPDLTNCAYQRGWTLETNVSSTWTTQNLSNAGLFSLFTSQESLLGLDGNAYYGFDTVSLGLKGSSVPVLQNQFVAGIATNDFWLGTLGLSPISFNFSDFNDPIPSLMDNLVSQSYTPSSAWAYTAGTSYRDPPVFTSLTLGGYDATRFEPDNVTIGFGADQSRDLVVGIQSITYNTHGSNPLLAHGINMFIDSLITQIWLPVEVCHAFEQAFNLTWNSTAELYLIDDHVHSTLLAQNPVFTFSVGAAASGGDTVDITIPYAAFDLNVTQPTVDSTTRYFPLKQAENNTQYTLGRVFLQEAYIIADYNRRNFSVSQALFPGRSAPQDLVPIMPPGSPESVPNHSTLHIGSIVGIVVGGIVIMTIIALLWIRQRRLIRKRAPYSSALVNAEKSEKIDLPSGQNQQDLAEMDQVDAGPQKLDQRNALLPQLPDGKGIGNRHELEQIDRAHEVEGCRMYRAELEGIPVTASIVH